MENTEITLVPYDKIGGIVKEKLAEIEELRLNGVTKIENLKNENSNIKRNKQLDKETKEKILNENKTYLEEANKVKLENKDKINALVSDLDKFVKANYSVYIKTVQEEHKKRKEGYLAEYNKELEREKEYYTSHMAELSSNKKEDLEEKKSLTLKHR